MKKTLQKKLKVVGFIIKFEHAEASALALDLAQLALGQGKHILFEKENAAITKKFIQLNAREKGIRQRIKNVTKEQMIKFADFIVVLGGDGTYLSISRLMRTRSIPVLGINMGQLGFLTEIKQGEAFDTMNHILSGKPVKLSERALMDVSLYRQNRLIFNEPAVNDAVITKGATARIIALHVFIGNQLVNTIRADGLIVSTPTGSTAYSLAAGGPIVEPSIKAFILSPVCPHSLTQRPIVIPDHSEIQIRLQGYPGQVMLTLDGQKPINMKKEDVVVVRKFKKHSLKLITSPTRDYFSLLHEKLMFGMR